MPLKMSRALGDHPELREFILQNVEQLGEERVLGTGSYGSVYEVKIDGKVYAAKMIHDVLLEMDEHGGVETIAKRYLRECRLIARIRHPNITQFIGLCFITGSRLPLLVMEKLDCSLDDLLESTPEIPLTVSKYILICICQGLDYIHRQSMIHRDLTARNVLLTVSLRAKITDFGNSRIVHLQPGQLAKTLTRFPGTLVYMAPEALSDSDHSVYGASLDVFSFGVLQLFVLTQVFPGDLLAPTYPDPNSPDLLLARSEFERRSTYTSLLKRKLPGGHQHPLFALIQKCLANVPERRPTSSQLLSSLEGIGTETEGGILQLDIARVRTARALRAKDKRIETLQGEVAKKDTLLTQKDTLLAEKDILLKQKDTLLAEKDTQLAQQQQDFQSDLVAKIRELAAKDRQITQHQVLITDVTSQRDAACAEKKALIQAHKEQIGHKDAELARRAALIQQLEGIIRSRDLMIQERGLSVPASGGAIATKADHLPQKLRPPLTLKWRRGKDLPIEMGGNVQSVVIDDAVYVGGGSADGNLDRCTVMKLDIQQEEWFKLPQYNAKLFAMISLDNRLALVGGYDPVTRKLANQIGVLDSEKWTHPYPPMNIARHSSIAVSFDTKIIVAGGQCDKNRTISSVEVLDVPSSRWYVADPLPNPRTSMKLALIRNTLYLMGGYDHIGSRIKVVHMVNLNELIKKAVSKTTTKTTFSPWQALADIPLTFSAPLAVSSSLLAVGGIDDNGKISSSIHIYQPDTKEWVKVGTLPTARYYCTCSVLPSREIIVAGGYIGPWKYINTVDFLSITEAS